MFYFCYYYKEIISYVYIVKFSHLQIEFTFQPWLKLKKTILYLLYFSVLLFNFEDKLTQTQITEETKVH